MYFSKGSRNLRNHSHARFYRNDLIRRVAEYKKPCTMLRYPFRSRQIAQFAKMGLEVVAVPPVKVDELPLPPMYAIAKPRSARLVIEKSGCLENPYYSKDSLTALVEAIGERTTAQACAFLLTNARQTRGAGGCTQEVEEEAILNGVFFGFASCDIEYFVSTRFRGEAVDPVSQSLAVDKIFNVKDWPDCHIMCGSCALQKIVELAV